MLFKLQVLVLLSFIAYSTAGPLFGTIKRYTISFGESAAESGTKVVAYADPGKPIPAAIKSTREVELVPLALSQDPITPTLLEVAPLELPVQILYNSKSSPVLVHQNHIPGLRIFHCINVLKF